MKLRLAAGSAMVALACMALPGLARADEPPASAPSSAVPGSTATTAAEPAAPTTEPPPAASKRTVWPWVLMGTGVALVVTATVLQVNAVSQDDKREADEVRLSLITARPASDPEKSALQRSRDDHEKSASSGRTAALIVGTVGFLTIAGSVVLWFFEGSSSSSSPPPAAKLRPSLTPSFGPTYAGASLGASF